MIVVFVEYRINEDELNTFTQEMEKRMKGQKAELLLGTDQPGLFVEMWTMDGEDEADRFRADRRDRDDSPWRELDRYVDGGRQKLHVWPFRKVI